MDTLRGGFGGYSDAEAHDPAEDEFIGDAPPPAIGQDERRLQVRAYNMWARMLGDRRFPLIADLEAGNMPDFDPWSVLLDFSAGVENPAIRYIGDALARESVFDPAAIRTLSDVPGRSMLSRITDHYLQIIANEAPIGFEAEFVNQNGRTVLYRGILLPFSGHLGSDGIDLIYGVINWKELADQQTTDELMLAIDQMLEATPARDVLPLTEWADGPADGFSGMGFTALGDPSRDADSGLADILASARDLAEAARGAEDRSRRALYAAIGRAHDFALAAAAEPDDFAELIADAGLAVQERAPLLPVVKLVFGADYDKTRLTEFATAIAHAQRIGLPAGALAGLLGSADGGLKGVVNAERALRRAAGAQQRPAGNARQTYARRLRALPAKPFSEIAPQGEEFTLILARRDDGGQALMLGELADEALIARVARRLLG